LYSFGTDEYIAETVRAHSDSMLRAAYSVLHSAVDAEDAAQEAFVLLMTKAPEFRGSEHQKAWLLRVTINIARNMRKKKERECQPVEGDIPSPAPPDGELLQLVLALPEKYSTVIHLYYYEGYSIREIADILRIPSATVGTRLARGRAELRARLGEDADAPRNAVPKGEDAT